MQISYLKTHLTPKHLELTVHKTAQPRWVSWALPCGTWAAPGFAVGQSQRPAEGHGLNSRFQKADGALAQLHSNFLLKPRGGPETGFSTLGCDVCTPSVLRAAQLGGVTGQVGVYTTR